MRRPALLLLALPFLVPGHAGAERTVDEGICQVKASATSWSYCQKAIGCLVSCQRRVRSGDADPAECVPPYANKTFGCFQGKQGRANGSICSACSRDTPECYPADPCPTTTHQFLTTIDFVVDQLRQTFWCDDGGSPDGLTPYEAKCQDARAKYAAKAAHQTARCYGRCRQNELKGILLPGACAVPTTDPYTQTCLMKNDTTTAYRIDRYCGVPGSEPECASNFPGIDWAQLARVTVESFEGLHYCEQ